jgi:hypothetical protein
MKKQKRWRKDWRRTEAFFNVALFWLEKRCGPFSFDMLVRCVTCDGKLLVFGCVVS